ncbi:hypothetical protein BS50DRAFT_14130 [Corynespora cassiicola Philippines]|uniref:Uncharacterized protein n=1 Tax=Corynespora cassiicola Philippines TaxID=1448308 RepID=A0A2T2P9P4_CORCC|nr:hypothetical protein BS50DRAFT_14130 [Corynespora cassiicola Philippines]
MVSRRASDARETLMVTARARTGAEQVMRVSWGASGRMHEAVERGDIRFSGAQVQWPAGVEGCRCQGECAMEYDVATTGCTPRFARRLLLYTYRLHYEHTTRLACARELIVKDASCAPQIPIVRKLPARQRCGRLLTRRLRKSSRGPLAHAPPGNTADRATANARHMSYIDPW